MIRRERELNGVNNSIYCINVKILILVFKLRIITLYWINFFLKSSYLDLDWDTEIQFILIRGYDSDMSNAVLVVYYHFMIIRI